MLFKASKSQVLLVDGESGSGKSAYAIFGVVPGVPRLYIEAKQSHFGTKLDWNKEDRKFIA